MQLDELSTPCLVIEESRLAENLRRMQERADSQSVALRPHIKTHKSVVLAARQRELGARGLTVAKPSEAEVFVDAGFDDVRLAYVVVGTDKLERLARLAERARISFCVDTVEGARAAADFFRRRGTSIEVLLEVDCGYGRAGVAWNDPDGVELARAVDELQGLELVGLLTHAGQAYHGPAEEDETSVAALQRTAADERDRTLGLARRLLEAGLFRGLEAGPEVSIGSTPTMAVFENVADAKLRVSEIRPGSYVFNDLTQVALGAARLEDCAVTVLTTVTSVRQEGSGRRAILDAGKKILTSDRRLGADGFGLLLADAEAMTPLPDAQLHTLSEEHGWVRLEGEAGLRVGERVRLVPNHVCVAVDTQNEMYLVEGSRVKERLPVEARGCVL